MIYSCLTNWLPGFTFPKIVEEPTNCAIKATVPWEDFRFRITTTDMVLSDVKEEVSKEFARVSKFLTEVKIPELKFFIPLSQSECGHFLDGCL